LVLESAGKAVLSGPLVAPSWHPVISERDLRQTLARARRWSATAASSRALPGQG
jgi:hypothetical protein